MRIRITRGSAFNRRRLRLLPICHRRRLPTCFRLYHPVVVCRNNPMALRPHRMVVHRPLTVGTAVNLHHYHQCNNSSTARRGVIRASSNRRQIVVTIRLVSLSMCVFRDVCIEFSFKQRKLLVMRSRHSQSLAKVSVSKTIIPVSPAVQQFIVWM